jgi:aldose sugar dehydrogenase
MNGTDPDARSGILRLTQDGKPVPGGGILGEKFPLNLYYAYGLANSFGIDFDPITKNLWDTENGPAYGDEINVVKPGFNSGWTRVAGIWESEIDSSGKVGYIRGKIVHHPNNLVDFGGKGKYSEPEFTSNSTMCPSAIKFFDSNKLGKKYKNDIFVAIIKPSYILHFDLNKTRTGLVLDGSLTDKIANSPEELEAAKFGKGFGAIPDLQVGPDGYLYVISFIRGIIYKIIPVHSND